jgi:hypothetical protein
MREARLVRVSAEGSIKSAAAVIVLDEGSAAILRLRLSKSAVGPGVSRASELGIVDLHLA